MPVMKKPHIIIVVIVALVLGIGVLVLVPIVRVIENPTTACGEQWSEGTGFSSYSPDKQYVAFSGSIGRLVDISVVDQTTKTTVYAHKYCLGGEASVAQPIWGNDSSGFEIAYTTRLGDRWVRCTYHVDLETKHFSLNCHDIG
jgi:hypothetical protein